MSLEVADSPLLRSTVFPFCASSPSPPYDTKGEISKSGVPILPSKRARKIPEKIQVSKEDLAELSPSAQPDVNVEAPSEAEENDDVSLDQVSEAEEQVSDNVSDEENNS